MPTIVPIAPSSVTGVSTPGGASFVSGTQSGYNGPWAVETQTLTVTYARVPFTMALASGSADQVYSLSADNTRITQVKSTGIRALVTATYKVVKDYNSYSTSSHQQPQRFAVLSEADQFGDTYGSGTAGNSYLLGPAGTVITTQPYIRRVAWVEGTDAEVTRSVNGANCLVSDGVYGASVNAVDSYADFNQAIGVALPHTFLNDYDNRVVGTFQAGNSYILAGAYSKTKETDQRFIAWLDGIADLVTNTQLYRSTWALGVDYNIDTAGNVTQISSTTVGASEYDKSRHLYS